MASQIILTAAKKGVHLYLKGNSLAYKASKGALTVDLKKTITENKQKIISFLMMQGNDSTSRTQVIHRLEDSTLSIKLSYSQQRLWLLDQIDGGSAHYNMPAALKLSGKLDVVALNQAFTTILSRHESLRTVFAADDAGTPFQLITPAAEFAVEIDDLSQVEPGPQQLAIAERVTIEAGKLFDLGNDLMLRAQLLKLAENEHMLLVTMHHIASDGWSMAILINEFKALYSAYVQGLSNPLPALEVQYADYAHWQRNWLQGEVLDSQLGYWEKQLSGLPEAHNLPLDYARPKLQSFVGRTYSSQLDKDTSQALNTLCQAQGATLFMGLHAAFSTLLSRYSNETDIVVGSPIANREQTEVAELIGFFVNTLVLRSDLSENPSFNSLLNQSKTMLLDAYAHQQVPFEQIVERLQPARSLSHSPLFQVMLILQNNEQSILELPDLTLKSVEQQSEGVVKFDLTLNIQESEQGMLLGWEYNTDLFDERSIIRMAGHFNTLLNALISTPDESVFKVEMLNDQERHQLLVEWNDTAADYPKDKCIHELFETQVKA
ncbi:condensation domain-containing protein, partial [Motilimonas pumila]